MATPSAIDRARARLAADRAATASRLAALQSGFAGVVAASEGSNADDEHDPEGSTIAYERSQLAALVAQAEAHLVDIDRASERIAAGDYGRCEVCGTDIPSGRLEARPTASTCIACAAGEHRHGGGDTARDRPYPTGTSRPR
ncbi:TraR/DksA C4-type zinc finger protein [Humibacillus sp. DSM 29435]|uniref:TraR/DksA family transcriptional regulator n=1 Tax=Humibacillus sp. DSM 29435 TaxID=1869167 RepID=UPI0009F359F7